MANIYQALSVRAKTLFGDKPFEDEFSPSEEADHISGGHLEIVPRPYEVLSNNYSAGKQGSVVELALPVEQEAALIQGGHIKRVEKPAKKK